MNEETQEINPQQEAQTTPVEPAETVATAEQTHPEEVPALLESEDLQKIIETLLFITDRPVKVSRLVDVKHFHFTSRKLTGLPPTSLTTSKSPLLVFLLFPLLDTYVL